MRDDEDVPHEGPFTCMNALLGQPGKQPEPARARSRHTLGSLKAGSLSLTSSGICQRTPGSSSQSAVVCASLPQSADRVYRRGTASWPLRSPESIPRHPGSRTARTAFSAAMTLAHARRPYRSSSSEAAAPKGIAVRALAVLRRPESRAPADDTWGPGTSI
jgi:hypothetical protein